MTYMHTKTGATAELVEKTETAVALRDASTQEVKEISISTFKRWWKAVEDEPADAKYEYALIDISGDDEEPTAETESVENNDETAENGSEDAQNEPEEFDADEDLLGDEDEPAENVEPQDESAPLSLSDITKKLEGLFDTLNDLYFENKLSRPVITVQSTPRAYGHCSSKKIWASGVEDEGESYYEINIGAEHLNRPSENTAATMCHEMVHLLCREYGMDETCQNGRYHNKLFKQEAEKRDLTIDYDRAIGYSITSPSETFVEKLRAAGYALEVPFARHTIERSKDRVKRAKAKKYVCPTCGQEVKSTSDLNLICGNCEVKMECAS